MLSPERCPGPEEVEPEEVEPEEVELEEVEPEEVQEWRECMSGGSVQVEEGQSSRRKVRSWTWKCPKPLVDLTEEAEQEQEQN